MRANQSSFNRKKNNIVARTASFVLEQMEDRRLLSGSVITAWNFNNLTIGTNLSPAPSTGSGTALSVGMQTATTNTNSPGGTYAYPNPNASGSGDISDILVGSGNNSPGPDLSSEGTGANAWRVRGSSDGWSDNAAIGSQGAQFSASTVGYTGITASFDIDASSKSAPDQFQVQYTIDGTNWTNATSVTSGTTGNGATPAPTDGTTVVTNTSNSSIVNGTYVEFTSSPDALYWQNGLTVNLAGVTGVNNNAKFGIRIVNAATGTAEVEQGGTAYPAAGAGNYRIDDVQILGTPGSATGPTITTSPASQVVAAGSRVTLTSAASGTPTPSVQWYYEAPSTSSFVADTTDSGNTSSQLIIASASSGQSGNKYEAVYSNTAGTATTSPAILTVASTPLITSQPASQTVAAGTTVTLLATAIGAPAPTVQWQVSSNGGAYSPISGATQTFLTVSATEATTGNQYEAVFTNTQGTGASASVTTATSQAATLTVQGTPITQWDFTSGQAATPGGNTDPGTANSPLPTSAINSGNAVSILGMNNSYDGLPSHPEADIIPLISSVDPSVEDYVWRVRGGLGQGPTGSPGTPDGWSQNAPQYTQGVDFTVNTTGFTNVTLHYDWTQGAIGDMQPQYYNGSSWVNIGQPIQATGSDYYGVTAPTTLSNAATLAANTSTSISVASGSGFYYDQAITIGGVNAVVTSVNGTTLTVFPTTSGTVSSGASVAGNPDPTGVTVNLQGISYANNNPALQVRLVSVYDPALPSVIDGNPAVSQVSHGQYASGFGLANDIQVIDLDNYVSSGGTSSAPDGQSFTLTFGGQTTGSIAYSSNPTTMASNIQTALQALSNIGAGNVSVASTIATNNYTPPGPITSYNGFSVIFAGALKDTPVSPITISDTSDNVSTWQNATPSTITTTLSAPATLTENVPVTLAVASTSGFAAGNPILLNNTTCLISSVGTGTLTVDPEGSGSAPIGATVKQIGATGFVDGGGSWEFGNISFNGDTAAGYPGIITNPTSQTTAGGYPATFTATAYSESTPTVTWQVLAPGGSWSTVSGGTVSPTGGTFSNSSSDQYTSTYTFTTDSNLDQNGDEYRAVFTNGVGGATTTPATLTVVAPAAPYVTIQPSNESVQEGQETFFSAYGSGNPSPTIQWQVSTNSGGSWSNLSDTSAVNGSATNILTVAPGNTLSQNGTEYRADFHSSVADTYSNAVTMSVLPTESVLTAWDFGASQYAGAVTADSYSQSPAPVAAGNDNSLDVGGTLTPLGMNLPFNSADPASGNGPPGAVDAEDITSSSPAAYSTYSEDFWRVRGGISSNPATAGSPANGWSNFVQPSTQGAQVSVPTTGYSNVYVTLEWYVTHSGEQNAQRQYSIDGGNTWQNLGSQLTLLAPGNDDYYGDSPIGYDTPVVFDLTGVSGANNNPNLQVRLVNSYSLILSNQQNLLLNDSSNFTLSFNGQTTGTIVYSPTQAIMISNIQTALGALSNVGANNVSVSYNAGTGTYVAQFQGTLGTSIQPVMTINTTSGADAVTQKNQYANAQPNVNGNPFTSVPFNGSKGNWRFNNIFVHGTAATPPTIVSTQVGSGSAQRSSLKSLSVTFNEPVSLATGSFTMYQEALTTSNGVSTVNTSGTPTDVSSDFTTTLSNSNQTVTFTLVPGSALDRTAAADIGLLTNGIYQLVLNGSALTDSTGSAHFDSSGSVPVSFANAVSGDNGTSNYFGVLFGDSNGDGVVNNTDNRAFGRDYGASTGAANYDITFDYNGDGTINNTDNRAFGRDYGLTDSY